jgi:alkylated DNA repair dioxygenase AlkB
MTEVASTPTQAELFAEPQRFAIPGLRYQTDFLSVAEELSLLEVIRSLDLREAQYRQWLANRRTIAFGGKYDFTANELLPAEPVPPFLFALRARSAAWSGLEAVQLNHAMIAEYRAGTQLGWHRDVPDFESAVGISLAGAGRLRFRPYPLRSGQRKAAFAIDLAPRSIYTLQGAARWDWQHAVSPTKALRYSITFRSLVQRDTSGRHFTRERPSRT